LTTWQAYSKLYYDSKLKDIVNNRWKRGYLAANPDHDPKDPIPPATLKFRNTVTQEVFLLEPTDVKQRVEEERERLGNDQSTEVGDDDGLDQHERERIKNAQQYQTYVYFRGHVVNHPLMHP
jgi:hypothetical protein